MVIGKPWNDDTPYADIEQGYLALGPVTIRVRYQTEHDKGLPRPSGFLTIKGQGTMVREEYEYPIPHIDAARMIYGMSGNRISKRRYMIEHQGHLWHVDRFLDDNSPLVLAEIELTAPDQEFARPEWIGEEVTNDARFANANLSISPWSTW